MDVTLIKKLANKLGISTDALLIPYYLIPYNFLNGYAFTPLRVVFEITYRCNLYCQMCPLANWKKEKTETKAPDADINKELDTAEIKTFIDELKSLKTRAIMITGGEPFLRQDMLEILDYIKNKGIYCSIISNGTLINNDTAKDLVNIGNEIISFSLDGTKDTHNRIRGRGDSFSKIYNTVETIQRFKNGRANPKVNFNFTISALNQDNLDEIVDVAHDLKINMINFLYLFYTSESNLSQTSEILKMGTLKPENQNINDEIKQIDINILKESIRKTEEKAKKYNVSLNFRPPLKGDEIEKRFFDPNFAYCQRCFYPWFETRLDPFGNIYPCSIDIPMGNIRVNSLKSIWNGKKYSNFRMRLKRYKLLPACAKCCKLNNKLWSHLPCI
ncbi:MAG: radical SAM protein [Candidatus Omnitrophota bacterium]|nr:radical SAM protein [Candidatus Omnitrophota bacterium]